MRRDVAHLTAGLIRVRAAGYTAQQLANSRKVCFQSCTAEHANEGQFCDRPHEYHMHVCASDCSLTRAALLLLNVLGTAWYRSRARSVANGLCDATHTCAKSAIMSAAIHQHQRHPRYPLHLHVAERGRHSMNWARHSATSGDAMAAQHWQRLECLPVHFASTDPPQPSC